MNPDTNYGLEKAGMAQLDDSVGAIMKALDDMGEANNTIVVVGTNRTSPFNRRRSASRAKAEIADTGNQPLLITPSNRTDPKLDSKPFINMGSEIFAHLANRAHSSLHAAGVASARSGWRPPRSRS